MAEKKAPVPTQDVSKDMDTRLKLFNTEFEAIQQKYQLRIIAQVVFPGNAVLSVPFTAIPFGGAQVSAPAPESKPEAETASIPE